MSATAGLEKSPTGIAGFDEITEGGIPRGRATLLIGGPGAGKTVFALETLFRGAAERGASGVFVAFEETPELLRGDVSSFDWYDDACWEREVAFVDAQLPEGVTPAGAFDLNGLLAGLEARLAGMERAETVVFDGVDVLLGLMEDPRAIRREVLRLRRWAGARGLTVLVTAKSRGRGDSLADDRAFDFLQFAMDCVVRLSARLVERTAFRALRVQKYRGSAHSADELPFVIGPGGITAPSQGGAELVHRVSEESVSSGVPRLDRLLGGGFWRGSSVLISGVPGTAKTTLAGSFAAASAEAGEPTLFVSFDESVDQIVRNLRSVGIDLSRGLEAGTLEMHALRTRSANVELHAERLMRWIRRREPRAVVIDPLSALVHVGQHAAESVALRLVDTCKSRGATLLSTSLEPGDPRNESTPIGLSTICDTWIHLSYLEHGGERNRSLSIMKSRGRKHSNQVRELVLDHGRVDLADVFTAGGEVLMGTLRYEREREAERRAKERRRAVERRRHELEQALAENAHRLDAAKLEHDRLGAMLEDLRDRASHDEEMAAREERRVADLRAADPDPGGGAE
ncbi:MAG TPA: circadian clock protein KaiC [Sandaracinaceae bacterium LLY-WYZ-13_1]|nr:circadian clock protein KaiC [Sandaracinaceae bacterium LLY-WYZ-13_1]